MTIEAVRPVIDWSQLTEDDLPYDDGIPMETPWHQAQTNLLIDSLRGYWAQRPDTFVGGNQFVYFNPGEAMNVDFRGPDFYAATGVRKAKRKSWLTWLEGKPPDVVVELLSDSTREFDKTIKKQVYQDGLQAPEYYWYDPETQELAGFELRHGLYEPLHPDRQGRLFSPRLGLALTRWHGTFLHMEETWLRLETPAGMLLLTDAEREAERADEFAARADEFAAQADELAARADEFAAQAIEFAGQAANERRLRQQQEERAERLLAQLRALGIESAE